jgi:2-phospho-L-lactate guanylyltransferase (CobY/MobA/RfbA family)
MGAPSWENLDDFLATDENGGFATPAVLLFSTGQRRTVSVIFDDPYFNAQLGEYDAESSQPRIMGKMSDLAHVKRGDVVRVDGQDYDVMTSALPDGTGMGTVMLAVQNAALKY